MTHCITRLRFTLADENAANKEAVEAVEGVLKVIWNGGQYQVVMGNVAGIFTPFLSVLTAAGMISAILVLLSTLGVLDSSSNTYVVFDKIANDSRRVYPRRKF